MLQMRQPPIQRMRPGTAVIVMVIVMVTVTVRAARRATDPDTTAATGRRRLQERRLQRHLTIAQTVQVTQTGQLIVAARAGAHVIGARARRLTVAEAVLDAGAHTAAFVQGIAELAPKFACN